jgi:hypothetical protein
MLMGAGIPGSRLTPKRRPGREQAAKFTLLQGAAATPVPMEVPVW